MKQLTGETSKQQLRGGFYFKITLYADFRWACTNIKYNVKSNDSGTWRRIDLLNLTACSQQ
jgi:hypothetical protein